MTTVSRSGIGAASRPADDVPAVKSTLGLHRDRREQQHLQTESASMTGAIQGIGGAVACTGFHDVSVERIASVLDCVF
jgi:hypothetical protein